MSKRIWAALLGRRAEWVIVVGAVAAGVVLRFVAASPVWLDEALSVEIASRPIGSIDDLLRHDGHPPLYYWLLHGWMELFGSSDESARALSGILGLGAWITVTVIAHQRGGARAARSAVVVMGLLPFALRYSSEARMYSLVTLEVALGWLALERGMHRPTMRRLTPVAVLTGALLLTHYWTIYLLATVGIGLILRARSGGADASGARRAIAAMVVGGLTFMPWLPAFLYQAEHTGTPWATAARPTQVLAETATGLAGGLAPESVLLAFFFGVLAAAAARTDTRWARRAGGLALATMVLGSIAGLASNSAFQSRYAAVIVPMVGLVVVAGVESIGRRDGRVAALAAIAALSLGATGVELGNDRSQSRVIAAAIVARSSPGEPVVVCPDQLGPALHRELDGSGLDLLAYPGLGDAALVDWVDYADRHRNADPEAVAEAVLARARGVAVWLVWNDSYRTVTGHCSGLVEALSVRRVPPELVVAAAPGEYFEHANLMRFPAR